MPPSAWSSAAWIAALSSAAPSPTAPNAATSTRGWRAVMTRRARIVRRHRGPMGFCAADDSAAIQAALDHADGGIVALHSGRAYRVSRPLIADVRRVRGFEGDNARVVVAHDGACLRIVGSHTGSASPAHPSSQRVKVPEMNPFVRGVRIHADPPLRATGLQIEGTFGLEVSGCQLFDLATGIELVGRNRNVVLSGNDVWHCRDYGVWWHGGDLHQVNVVGNHVSYCRKVLFFDDASIFNVQIIGNALESSTSPDVVEHVVHAESRGRQIEGFEFIGNSLEDHWSAAGPSVRIDGGSAQRAKQLMIIGNDLGNSRNHDIHVSDANEVVIQGNSLDDSEEHSIKLSGRLTAVSVLGNVFRGEGERPMGTLLVGDDSAPTEVDGLVISENVADRMLRRPVVVRNASLVSARLSGNVLHFAGDEPGFAVDLTDRVRRLHGVHVVGNTLRADRATRALGLRAAEVSLLIARDNLAAGFGAEPYELPEAVPGAVIVADNLAG
jgi:hypothetical protein